MFLLGTQIQGLIAITHDSYEPKPYQGYLLVILMVTMGLLLNTWGAKQLPLIEGIILVLHVFGFATVIVVLWVLSPKNTADDVFFTFDNSGGWSSTGLSMLVGQVTSIYGLIGSDGAAHMAEETKDASVIVSEGRAAGEHVSLQEGHLLTFSLCHSGPTLHDMVISLEWIDGFCDADHLLLLLDECGGSSE